MSFALFCELSFMLVCCVFSAASGYYFGQSRGWFAGFAKATADRIEEEERVDRMISDSISLADTLDEPTMPRKFRQPRLFRWN